MNNNNKETDKLLICNGYIYNFENTRTEVYTEM